MLCAKSPKVIWASFQTLEPLATLNGVRDRHSAAGSSQSHMKYRPDKRRSLIAIGRMCTQRTLVCLRQCRAGHRDVRISDRLILRYARTEKVHELFQDWTDR